MFSTIYKKFFLLVAVVIMLSSLVIIITLGVKYSIDFTGGSLMEISYDSTPAKELVENAVNALGFSGFSVRESGISESNKTGYLIRTKDLSEAERIQLETAMLNVGSGAKVELFTSVGPVIGNELKDKAIWAISIISLIIIIYVAYVFAGVGKPVSSWVYGGITILVLFHDILVPTAMMSLLGWWRGAEVDVLFVMAILAVLGYSVNDTIVIFDRVRENLRANRTEKKVKQTLPGGVVHEAVEYTLTKPFSEIVGSAVSLSLARSINTSFTTLVALTALFFFGGSLTQNFALVLIAGVIAGTYSSICIASPLLVTYADYIANKKVPSEK